MSRKLFNQTGSALTAPGLSGTKRISIGADGQIAYGKDDRESLVDALLENQKREQAEEMRKNIAERDFSSVTDAKKLWEEDRQKKFNETLERVNSGERLSNVEKETGLSSYTPAEMNKLGNAALKGVGGQSKIGEKIEGAAAKTAGSYLKGVITGGAEIADALKANAAGVKGAYESIPKPDENGMLPLMKGDAQKKAFTDAKINELLFGESYADEIAEDMGNRYRNVIEGKYGESGKAMQLWENAMEYSGRMVTTELAETLATNLLPGIGWAGRAAGIVTMGLTSDASYMKEAAASMLEENARLQKMGLPAKYSDDYIRRKATAAGVNGVLIEAIGEYALGGLENRGEGFVDDLLKKKGVGKQVAQVLGKTKFGEHIVKAFDNPVGKGIAKYAIGSAEEGLEEIVQGIAGNAQKKLYDDKATVFTTEDWKEYLESGIVGTIMGATGGAVNAVASTASGLQTMEYVKQMTQAANAVRTDAEAADVSAIIAAEIGTLDDIISEAREKNAEKKTDAGTETGKESAKKKNGKKEETKSEPVKLTGDEARKYASEFYEAEENGGVKTEERSAEKTGKEDGEIPEEVENLAWARDRLATVLEILSDRNTRSDIEANNIAKGQADNGIKTGYELFYEGNAEKVLDDIRSEQKKIAEEQKTAGTVTGAQNAAQNVPGAVQNVQNAEQNVPGMQSAADSSTAGAQEAFTERANENTGDDGIELVGDSDAEFDAAAELESSGVRRDLAEYGIDVTVVRNGDSLMDPKTGRIQISSTAKSRDVLNMVIGHEIAHGAARGDVNFTKDVISAFRDAGVDVDNVIRGVQETYINGYIKRGMSEEAARRKVSWNFAMEETAAELTGRMNRNGDLIARLAQRNQSVLAKIYDAIMDIIGNITGNDKLKREYRTLAREIRRELKAQGFDIATKTGKAEIERVKAESEDRVRYDYRVMMRDEDRYREMLQPMLDNGTLKQDEFDRVFDSIDRAMDIVVRNLEILDFNYDTKKIGNRKFKPVKDNSDPLYKVSVDFSTLCRKRLLQQAVMAQLQEALGKDLTRDEQIEIRDRLREVQAEGRRIEIACALCYVESTRLKQPKQFRKFLADRETVLKDYFSEADPATKEKMDQYEKQERAKRGIEEGRSLKSMKPADARAIRDAKKRAKAEYVPTAEQQAVIDRSMKLKANDFTTPQGLTRLAEQEEDIYRAYTTYIRNATKSKGLEADVNWEYGDSNAISDQLISAMNAENGLRMQSWSDFQAIHLMDYMASTIELFHRGAKRQSYTKVPDYVMLMGKTGDMINMSLIPAAKWTGKLEYDSVEGIDYERALELREMFPDTAGTICIGINPEQLRALLNDSTIDMVIPYHHSGMSKEVRIKMHIPQWKSFQNEQSEKQKDYPETDTASKQYRKKPNFSEWFDIDRARATAERENANPSDPAEAKRLGKLYGGYMAMKEAADNYVRICHERGLQEKFADYAEEPYYWKLLTDRKMVNQKTGEVIEQQVIKPEFDPDTVEDILNREIAGYAEKKRDEEYATGKVVKGFLTARGMSEEEAAKKMQDVVGDMQTAEAEDSGDGKKARFDEIGELFGDIEDQNNERTEKNAREIFGLTDNFAEAGYIMSDGSMLDFSNKKRKGEREYDHRVIASAYGETVDYTKNHGFSKENGKYLEDFVENGNIRIDAGDLSLNMDMGLQLSKDKPLTREQEEKIKDLVRWNKEREEMFAETASEDDKLWHEKPISMYVEFGGNAGRAMGARTRNASEVKSLHFEGKSLNPERVINEIRNYYETGEVREIPEIESYFYRMDELDDIDLNPQKRKRTKSTTTKAAMKERSRKQRQFEHLIESGDVDKIPAYALEDYFNRRRSYWRNEGYKQLRPDDMNDTYTTMLQHDVELGMFGDPTSIDAQVDLYEVLSKTGNKDFEKTYKNLISVKQKMDAAERERKAKEEAVKAEEARIRELTDSEAPLPEYPTNEDAEPIITEEYGEAPREAGYNERTSAAISQQETEEAAREAERERVQRWADERAKELADDFGITDEIPPEGIGLPKQENPDIEGIDIPSLKSKEVSEPEGKKALRVRAAEMQVINAMREHERMKQAYRNRADNEKRKGIGNLYEPVYRTVSKAIAKLTPRGTMERGKAVDAEDARSEYVKKARETEINTMLKRMKRIESELYDVDTDSSILNDWKYASDEKRKELEDRYPALHDYRMASDRVDELRGQKRASKFTSEYQHMMYEVNGLLTRQSQTEEVTQDTYDKTMRYILAYIGDYAQKTEGAKTAGERYFTAETAEERAKILEELKQSEDKSVKQLAKMIEAFRVIEENADGLDAKAQEIDRKWEDWYTNTVENSSRMKELRDTYESYQADLDAMRLSLGNKDLTEEELEAVKKSIEKRREEAQKTRDVITDADRVMAREFLDSAEEIDEARRGTKEFVQAYMVAQRILDADAAEPDLAEDERAARRLEDYRSRADNGRKAFIDANREEIERYMAQGETEESAALLVRRDQRKAEQQRLQKESVLGKLGYHIAGAVRDDYGNADEIRANEDMVRKTRKSIGAYIRKFNVNPHVDSMAQDVAKNKMTILETGLAGVQLENLRGLVPMYRELYDYERNGIKARKSAVINQQMNELDYAFREFDPSQIPKDSGFVAEVMKALRMPEKWRKWATSITRSVLQKYSNPENVLKDIFGDTEIAQYLTDNYINPTIRNSAEARKMTDAQIEKLNSYHLSRDESALTQIIAEYANLAENSMTPGRDDTRPVLSRESLIRFLKGEITAKELTQKLGVAEIGALVGDQVTDKQAQKMTEEAEQEGEIDTESKDSDFERDLKRQTDEFLARNGVKTGDIEAKTGLELTLEKIAEYAKNSGKTAEEIADKTMRAASDMRGMMNDMYEAINEMYVTHGGKELKYRKNYMPHQQPEDVKKALDEVFGMMDMEKVKELPVEIAGRTREFRPYRKWQKFEQQRKGNDTVYDAVGNVADYLRAANEGIYHIDDIMKLRTLETYIRNRYSENRQDYRKMILDEMLETEQALRRDIDEKMTAEDKKAEEAVMSELVQYLKLYTDDLAGKQVFRDTEEILGRKALNAWAKIVSISNKALIDFNVGSSLKQLSQMPGVAAIVGRENAKLALECALKSGNALNEAYDIENRSTFLAEKRERAQPDYGDKTNVQIALDAVSDGLAQFDRLNSRFSVYAFFMKAQDEGMEANEALEYADRMSRQINASRMRGAAPLIYRSKNLFANIINIYQRETTAQWELYTKILPQEFRKYYEKNGKEATVKLVAKKILEHQIATGLFNTLTSAIGLGTPAMFDIFGTFIRSFFKSAIPDDDELTAFERFREFFKNVGEEIADDLGPIANVYEFFRGDDTGRLPIGQISMTNVKKFGGAAVQTVKDIAGGNASFDTFENLLQGFAAASIDIMGAFAPGGGQLKKTLHAAADIARGGHFSGAGTSGKLQYAIPYYEIPGALVLGVSSTNEAQKYYEDYRALSEKQTEVWKKLTDNGVNNQRAYEVIRSVSAAGKKADKEAAIDGSGLGGYAKAMLWQGMVATDKANEAIRDAAGDLTGADYTEVVSVVRKVAGLKTTREKIGAILDGGLDDEQMMDVYADMVAEWEKDDDGNPVRMTDYAKIKQFEAAGMGIKGYLEAKKEYQDINAEDGLSAQKKAASYFEWADDKGFTDSQIDLVTDTFKYYNNVSATTDTYRKYKDAGLEQDKAFDIMDAVKGKTKIADKTEAIRGMYMSDEDTLSALSVVLSESTYGKVKAGIDAGMKLDDYVKVLRGDTDGNGRLKNDERQAVIDGITGLDNAARSVLWIATGGSDAGNPYAGIKKKTSGAGFGGFDGFGGFAGFGGFEGFGGFGSQKKGEEENEYFKAFEKLMKK